MTARRHKNPNQRTLGLERSDDEAKAVFDLKLAAVDPATAGVSDAVWQNVAQLLESLFFFADRDKTRYAAPKLEKLIANADLSRSVLGRAKKAAKEIGLITTERPRIRRGESRLTDRVWIHHDVLDRLVERSRDARRVPAAPAVGRGGKRWEDIKETSSPPSLHSSNPPPTPPAQPAGGSPGQADAVTPVGWGGILKELESEGVGCAAAAVAKARANGASPADARLVIAAWREGQRIDPPAWGVGLLVVKLKACRPGVPPEFPSSEPLEALKDREARLERRRQEDAKAAARSRQQEADAAAKADQRDRLAELDAAARSLSAEEFDRLLAGLPEFYRELAERNRFNALVLSAIADQLLETTA